MLGYGFLQKMLVFGKIKTQGQVVFTPYMVPYHFQLLKLEFQHLIQWYFPTLNRAKTLINPKSIFKETSDLS